MKPTLLLLLLAAAPLSARADVSKEAPSAAPAARKLPREWQVESRLFAADKDAPSAAKGANDPAHRPSSKLK